MEENKMEQFCQRRITKAFIDIGEEKYPSNDQRSNRDFLGYLNNFKDALGAVTIINGTGGAGKTSFVNYCRTAWYSDQTYPAIVELSSIDKVRNLVNELIKPDDCRKTDYYRTLLADVKQSWLQYDPYGPTNDLMKKIRVFLELHNGKISEYFKNIVRNRENQEELNHLICPWYHVFIHIREKEEIEKFIKTFQLEYPNTLIKKLLITGRVDPSEHSNDADRYVEEHLDFYDEIVYNHNDKDCLRISAERYLLNSSTQLIEHVQDRFLLSN